MAGAKHASDGFTSPVKFLPPLTSLRFFAALLVFMWHEPLTQPFAQRFDLGPLGVSFFFMLSGFILALTYRQHFARGLSRGALWRFYVARFARIYPVHLATLALMLCVSVTLGGPLWTGASETTHVAAVVAAVLLAQAWFPDVYVMLGANGPSWSISAEAFFYLVFPLLAVSVRRTSVPYLLAYAFVVWSAFAYSLGQIPWHADDPLVAFPPARIGEFAAGTFLGFAFSRRMTLLRSSSLLEAAGLAFLAVCVFLTSTSPAIVRSTCLLAPCIAVVIVVFAEGAGACSRWLSHPVMVRLGEISYAFYLVHVAVLISVAHFAPVGAMSALMSLAITLAMSLAIFLHVEQPARERIRLTLSTRRQVVVAEPRPLVVASSPVK